VTKRTVSIGKYRALQRASTPQGHFAILAVDHQDALRRVMRPDAPETITVTQIVEFKAQVVRALAPATSGILLDPIYGAAQIEDLSQRQVWLEQEGRERLRRLSSAMAQGRPWTSLLGCEPVSTHWYRTYAGLKEQG
jgi:tagatose-1,6-bisphosphate aldolase